VFSIETKTLEDKDISIWAKKIYSQHPDVLKQMRWSADTLERVIAIRIMINAGVKEF
jgi:hypothetical protein